VAKIAFFFAGQGAQVVGMGKVLCENLPAARALFDRARDILGYDLADVCANGPEAKLNSTVVSQPAIFVASLAALESLKQSDPPAVQECAATAGLSLGEYTALVFAGALDFEAGLKLVQERGEAMQAASDATPSGMVSILGLERDKVEELCTKVRPIGRLWIANLLCPGNIVVSGDKAACDEAERLASELGAMKTIRLPVAGAFHTEIMKPADEKLAAALSAVQIKAARIPVWSNFDAQPHMRALLAEGFDRFFELGPGRVLAGLLKRIQRKVDCQNIPA
jgi:[acyl-carrier-protein] S-malonyltransferase